MCTVLPDAGCRRSGDIRPLCKVLRQHPADRLRDSRRRTGIDHVSYAGNPTDQNLGSCAAHGCRSCSCQACASRAFRQFQAIHPSEGDRHGKLDGSDDCCIAARELREPRAYCCRRGAGGVNDSMAFFFRVFYVFSFLSGRSPVLANN